MRTTILSLLLALPLASATGAHSVCFANAGFPGAHAPLLQPTATPKAWSRPGPALPTLYYPFFEPELVLSTPTPPGTCPPDNWYRMGSSTLTEPVEEAPAAASATTQAVATPPAQAPPVLRPVHLQGLALVIGFYATVLLLLAAAVFKLTGPTPEETRENTARACATASKTLVSIRGITRVGVKLAAVCSWWTMKTTAWVSFKVIEWKYPKQVAKVRFLCGEARKMGCAFVLHLLYTGFVLTVCLGWLLSLVPATVETAAAAPTPMPTPMPESPAAEPISISSAPKPEVEEIIEVNTLVVAPPNTLRHRLSSAFAMRRRSSSSSSAARTLRSESAGAKEQLPVVRRRSVSDAIKGIFRRRSASSPAPAVAAF